MSSATEVFPNGVNVEQLVETVGAIQNDPSLAQFQFWAQRESTGGGRCRTTVQGFSGAGG